MAGFFGDEAVDAIRIVITITDGDHMHSLRLVFIDNGTIVQTGPASTKAKRNGAGGF